MGEALLLPPEVSPVAAAEQFAIQAIKEKMLAIGTDVQTVREGGSWRATTLTTIRSGSRGAKRWWIKS